MSRIAETHEIRRANVRLVRKQIPLAGTSGSWSEDPRRWRFGLVVGIGQPGPRSIDMASISRGCHEDSEYSALRHKHKL